MITVSTLVRSIRDTSAPRTCMESAQSGGLRLGFGDATAEGEEETVSEREQQGAAISMDSDLARL
jgi:hypothetical protein